MRTTTTVEVWQMVSALIASGIERQLASLPGVERVDVKYVAKRVLVAINALRLKRTKFAGTRAFGIKGTLGPGALGWFGAAA